jgi:hypothetical protein
VPLVSAVADVPPSINKVFRALIQGTGSGMRTLQIAAMISRNGALSLLRIRR